MKTILVQMSEKSWTMQSLHLACALARSYAAQVILLRLMPVGHPSYLGTSFGNLLPTGQECDEICECAATAEDYGVEMTVQPMQYVNTLEALVDAADQVHADAVFAHIRKSRFPYWHEFQMWSLRRKLSAQHCQLFTLDSVPQQEEGVPAITVEPAHTSADRLPSHLV